MRAEIIQANGIGAVAYEVDPFSINNVELVTLQGPQGQKGDKGEKGDPGNFRLDQLVPTDSASGSVASFSDGGDDLPIKSLQVAITPVQSGSGTPSPSNIRPISGWGEVKVTRTGKNLFDFASFYSTANKMRCTATQASDGKITVTSTTSSGSMWVGMETAVGNVAPSNTYKIRAKQGDKFICQCGGQSTGFYELDVDGKVLSTTETQSAYTVVNAECVALGFRLNFGSTTATGQTSEFYVQLELGSTATTYSPYQGNTYTVSLSSAGTVYGGTLDVVKGQLVVDYVKYTPTGTGTQSSGNLFAKGSGNVNVYYTLSQSSSPLVSSQTIANVQDFPFFRCSHYPFGNSSTTDSAYVGNKQLRVCLSLDDERNTANKFNTWVAQQYQNGTPLEFVAKLATPLTYTLSETQINTLLGINNIWADAGDSSVNFYADTKLYIDKQIALALNA